MDGRRMLNAPSAAIERAGGPESGASRGPTGLRYTVRTLACEEPQAAAGPVVRTICLLVIRRAAKAMDRACMQILGRIAELEAANPGTDVDEYGLARALELIPPSMPAHAYTVSPIRAG